MMEITSFVWRDKGILKANLGNFEGKYIWVKCSCGKKFLAFYNFNFLTHEHENHQLKAYVCPSNLRVLCA